MQKVMLDTSAFGEIINDAEIEICLKKAIEKQEIVFYGCKIVRKELRDTPKKKLLGNRHLRTLILSLYDRLIGKEERSFEITPIIETIAEEYFKSYKANRGGFSKEEIFNDFLIIACASLHNIEIVVSSDIKSMIGEKAVSAYKSVNHRFQITNPSFKKYKTFAAEIRRLYKSSDGKSN